MKDSPPRTNVARFFAICAMACGLLGIAFAFEFIGPSFARSEETTAKPNDKDKAKEDEAKESESGVEEAGDSKKRRVQQIRYGGREEKAPQVQGEKEECVPVPSQDVGADPGASGDSTGFIGQAGHLAFKTFGRVDSISPIEAMPYRLTDAHFLFGDVRGFVSNNSNLGGNFGLGYRNLREELNSWFGGSFWFDADGTTGKMYQQVGVSFEAMIQRVELRSNIYLPITSTHTFGSTASNAQIVGNRLQYNQFLGQGKALTGFDFEVGYNFPVPDPYKLRGFVGYYRFDGGPGGAINGFKTRLETVINNMVTAQVLYTNDPLFGSNFMLGCQIQFSYGDNYPGSWSSNTPSPFRFVERNYNVIVDRSQSSNGTAVAYNPLTNKPYNIEQVSSSAGTGGNGSTSSPFSTIAAAQGAGADVILVQGNSVINTPVTLSAGQFLLGDGSSQSLPLAGGGSVQLPNLIAAAQTPQISNVNGNAVTLASNTTVGGFAFSGIHGNAITGSGLKNVTIRDDVFQGIGGDAIKLDTSSGTFGLSNITVNSASGDGLRFTGGTADLSFSGSVNGTHGDGIALTNLTGGKINIANTSISSTNGDGLVLNSVATNVSVSSLSTSQTGGPAVYISGGAASDTYHFAGTTTIQSPVGAGFSVSGVAAKVAVDNLVVTSNSASPDVWLLNSSGPLVFSNLKLNSTNGTALLGNGLSSFAVSNGSITAANGPAIDVQSSTISLGFTQVSANGGPFGVRLLQDVGPLTIAGGNSFASGGLIQNTTTGMILNTNGNINLSWLDLAGNSAGIHSSNDGQLKATSLRITNSTGYAIDSLDDTSVAIYNSIFSGNGATGGGTIRVQASKSATDSWLLQGNTITDPNGTAVLLAAQSTATGGSLTATVQQNTITGSGSGGSLININGNGSLSAIVNKNTLTGAGPNMTGISIQNQDAATTVTSIDSITTNTIAMTNTQGTAVSVGSKSPNTVTLEQNTVTFSGTQGIGFRFNLMGLSRTEIIANLITDNAGGATGMLFDQVAASSTIEIDSQTITLLSGDTTVHRGIIFSAVTPTIQLLSVKNNIINNTTDLFAIPSNTSTGDIAINGTAFP